MKHMTVQQSIQYVVDHPVLTTDELLQLPVSELIVRSLFDISNNPDASIRGSMGRANKARKMLLDRLVGTRRPGSHPATRVEIPIEFVDLTAGELPTKEEE